MKLNKESLNDFRLQAITVLTAASAAMSQVEGLSAFSPVAAGVAFLFSASSFVDLTDKVDDLVDVLEDAGIIDEATADKIEEAVDKIEDVVEAVSDE